MRIGSAFSTAADHDRQPLGRDRHGDRFGDERNHPVLAAGTPIGIGILKEHDAGAKAEDLCRRHGISGTTFYKWKAKFGGVPMSAFAAVSTASSLDGCHGYANFLAAYSGRENAMGPKSGLSTMALGTLGGLILATTLCAQEGGPGAAWRGAGPQPCFGPGGGSYQCPQLPGSIAIRAGRLLDSKTGQMLPDQVVLVLNDRIAQVGPAAQIKIPDGARVIDLSKETVLPGLIDAHTHMFENPKPGMSRETSTLIAIQNTQLDLHAGFTAGATCLRIRTAMPTSTSVTASTKAASKVPVSRSRAGGSSGPAPRRPRPQRLR